MNEGNPMLSRSALLRVVARSAVSLAWSAPCRAHFPWLATDDDGRAILFFGESQHDREYKLPAALAEAQVQARPSGQKPVDVEMAKVEEDGFVGRRSAEAAPKGSPLQAVVRYGIYNGMLLDYYAKGLTTVVPAEWEKTGKSKELKLNATPRLKGNKIELVVHWDGKPLAGAKATMIDAASTPTEAETNAEGVATFETPGDGLVGFLVGQTNMKDSGKLGENSYNSSMQYATVTVMLNKSQPAAADAAAATALPSLPEPVASFGGAVCDGWLYVYGGHIGTEHDHSRDNLSTHFRRVRLDGGDQWEELPMQTPLQGLPLVAYEGKLYRVGGVNARNAFDEKEDMHSVAEFACYDPSASKWTEMPPLPEPRSSHDAVVIGDVLYVVGGWTLSGDSSSGKWLETAWSFDLTDAKGQWRPVANPPFKRRALAVAGSKDQLVVLGGMEPRGKSSASGGHGSAKVSWRADALDLATNQWRSLPDLPGEEMGGFGVSAWSLGGQLYVSGADGVVHRLADDGSAWESAGKLDRPRFFHRLLPDDEGALLAVAGASMDDGHLADIERFAPHRQN
jgi:N-acetylneuraminic acid mutarotase